MSQPICTGDVSKCKKKTKTFRFEIPKQVTLIYELPKFIIFKISNVYNTKISHQYLRHLNSSLG